MHALQFWFLLGVCGLIGFGALCYRVLRRRKPFQPVSPDGVLRRIDDLEQLLSPKDKGLKAWLDLLKPFVDRAKLAIEFNNPYRAQVHINLVAVGISWARTLFDSPSADTPRGTVLAKLSLALALMQKYRLAPAEEELRSVWLDSTAHLDAKRMALMARIWILYTQGKHQQAAEEEFLLTQLPSIVKMDGVLVDYEVCGPEMS